MKKIIIDGNEKVIGFTYPLRALFTHAETFTYSDFYRHFSVEMWGLNDGQPAISIMPYHCEQYLTFLIKEGIIYNVGTTKNGLYRYRQGRELKTFTL